MRALCCLALAGVLAVSGPARAEDLLVIGHPALPSASVSNEELASIYLIKKLQWPGGLPIVPVNREAASHARTRFSDLVLRQARTRFSDLVLRQAPNALAAYWNQMHFKGKLPPLIQESDAAVLAFVQNVPGAIGYVGAGSAPVNVKVLARVP
jgi:ABC-type phosphate transport system substrate-binding protein